MLIYYSPFILSVRVFVQYLTDQQATSTGPPRQAAGDEGVERRPAAGGGRHPGISEGAEGYADATGDIKGSDPRRAGGHAGRPDARR